MENKQEWKSFRDNGALWLANNTLIGFGWVLVVETDEDGEMVNIFPTQVKRESESDIQGYAKLTKHMENEFYNLNNWQAIEQRPSAKRYTDVFNEKRYTFDNIDLNRSATVALHKGERVLTSGGKFSK